MPSETLQNPYDNVAKADLHTIKFDNLFDKDEKEMQTLLRACERDGFFYLDLRSPGSGKLWSDLEQVGSLAKAWFDQPLETKLKTPTLSLAHGSVYFFVPFFMSE